MPPPKERELALRWAQRYQDAGDQVPDWVELMAGDEILCQIGPGDWVPQIGFLANEDPEFRAELNKAFLANEHTKFLTEHPNPNEQPHVEEEEEVRGHVEEEEEEDRTPPKMSRVRFGYRLDVVYKKWLLNCCGPYWTGVGCYTFTHTARSSSTVITWGAT